MSAGPLLNPPPPGPAARYCPTVADTVLSPCGIDYIQVGQIGVIDVCWAAVKSSSTRSRREVLPNRSRYGTVPKAHGMSGVVLDDDLPTLNRRLSQIGRAHV